jgi:hypothetical protein
MAAGHDRRSLPLAAVRVPATTGLVRPTKQVVDGPLRAVLAAGWHSTGLCGDLEQHVHDQER